MFSAFSNNGFADTLRLATFNNAEKTVPKQILTEAYKRLHIDIEFVYLPAERPMWSANNGIVDGVDARVTGLEKRYPNLLMINVPLNLGTLYVDTKDVSFTVNGWQSVKPYRIAYLRGSQMIERNLRDLPIESVTSIKQGFMMLAHNRVDIVIADVNQAAESLPDFPDIKRLSPAIYSFPVYHYVNKKHANLVPKLEAVLQQMVDDKTIEHIQQAFLVTHR